MVSKLLLSIYILGALSGIFFATLLILHAVKPGINDIYKGSQKPPQEYIDYVEDRENGAVGNSPTHPPDHCTKGCIEHGSIYEKNKTAEASSVCTTTECLGLANHLLSVMNLSANPCDDFFNYACGRFGEYFMVSRKDAADSRIFTRRRRNAALKALLTYPDVSAAITKAKNLYQRCLKNKNSSAINSALSTFWDSTKLPQSPRDTQRAVKNRISSFLWKLSRYRDPVSGLFAASLEPHKVYLVETGNYSFESPSYKRAVRTLKELSKSSNDPMINATDDWARDLLKFEEKLRSIWTRDPVKMTRLFSDIADLCKTCDFSELLPTSYVTVVDVEGFFNLHFLFTTEEVTSQYLRYLGAYMIRQRLSRPCEDIVTETFPGVIAYTFHQLFPPLDQSVIETYAQTMIEETKLFFKKNYTGLTDSFQDAVLSRLDKALFLLQNMSYSQRLSELESLYSQVDIAVVEWDQTVFSLEKAHLSNIAQSVGKSAVSSVDWDASLNTFYDGMAKQLVLNTAIFPFPFVRESISPSFIYGALGFLISQELFYGVNSEGYDDKIINLAHRTDIQNQINRCLVRYVSTLVDPLSQQKLNGSRTLLRDLADLVGLKIAISAHLSYKETANVSLPLPGLEILDERRLFFVGTAQTMCAQETATSNERMILTGSTTVSSQRLKTMMIMSADFAYAFQCPVGSKYNPVTPPCAVF